jgi:hypothetical protein
MYVRVMNPFAALVAAIIAIGTAFGIYYFALKTTNDVTKQSFAAAGISGDPTAATAGAGVGAGDGQSLYTTANFQHALKTAGDTLGAGASIELIKIEPGKLSVIGVKDGTAEMAIVAATGQVTKIQTPAPGTPAIPLESVDPKAPAAMLAAVEKRGITADQVSYMVVSALPGESPRWDLYTTTTPNHFSANAHGGALQSF